MRGRWVAVGMCSALVALATGMLYVALDRGMDADSPYRFFPYVALLLIAITPLVAAIVSGNPTWYAAGAGGVACGIAMTVFAAWLNSGGNGVMPLSLGIAVGGVIGLRADTHAAIYLRLAVSVLAAIYAVASDRILSIVFVYLLLGFADELADAIAARRSRPDTTEGDRAPLQLP